MAGRKRKANDNPSTDTKASTSSRISRPTRSTRSNRSNISSVGNSDVSAIYRDMLVEANVRPTRASTSDERPIKRKRPGQRRDEVARDIIPSPEKPDRDKVIDLKEHKDEDESADDLEFEDVAIPTATIQTVYRDSDEEEEVDDNDEVVFEDVDFSAHAFSAHASAASEAQDNQQDLELDLSARTKSTATKTPDRRKPINKAEKDRRIEIHKTHLLCLLAHVAQRNKWCNDPQVQDSLRPLLTEKMVKQLNPPSRWNQFGQANSLKAGLDLVNKMFKMKFQITERGMRRALWAETEAHLQDVLSNCPYPAT
ncbi:hypothetical protein O1611_g10528 [Lasiodiplodia mahajangana]|uniref:Uncharacterized protein n=1 Tax=Lasiodiplodia mahajangana TaxID=1108764 RepID=A0ACC2IXV6_9PEZI|nr:hypothetical protein O1611_g10528 [Lasiodiplodia mahajangana]